MLSSLPKLLLLPTRMLQRHPDAAAPPDVLEPPADSPAPRISVIRYTPTEIEQGSVGSAADLASWHERTTEGVLWVDVQGLGDAEQIREIGRIFNLHDLALADTVNTPQRPKVEEYEDQLFIVFRMIRLVQERTARSEQVSVFHDGRCVITFQEHHGDNLDPVRERIRRSKGLLRRKGAEYLAYAVIDTLIDGYYPVLEKLVEEIEDLEERILAGAQRGVIERLQNYKRELLTLRRVLTPQRELIHWLVREESEFLADENTPYWRDCYDHISQLLDALDGSRELANGLVDLHLSNMSARMNEVMKFLTLIATIFIPLSFIAGVYGMNFEHMPELGKEWGYPAIWGVFVIVGLGLLAWFWHKGWIGSGR